jgi:hypothetical protein
MVHVHLIIQNKGFAAMHMQNAQLNLFSGQRCLNMPLDLVRGSSKR